MLWIEFAIQVNVEWGALEFQPANSEVPEINGKKYHEN